MCVPFSSSAYMSKWNFTNAKNISQVVCFFTLFQFGESGKSTRELEKTIALLKKVVERVQQENEKLKKSPGLVSTEQMALLKRENEGLKVSTGN